MNLTQSALGATPVDILTYIYIYIYGQRPGNKLIACNRNIQLELIPYVHTYPI